MRNIEKKWSLFLIATFVTIFGVIDTLLNDTHALDEEELKDIYNNIKLDNCLIDHYVFDSDNGYVYVRNDNINDIDECLDASFKEIEVIVDEENSKLQISYMDIVLKELKLFSIDFGSYNIDNDSIYLENGISYNDFICTIDKFDELDYKIYNGSVEIINGLINDDMVLEIYYNNRLLDKFDIVIVEDIIKDYNNDGIIDLRDIVKKKY